MFSLKSYRIRKIEKMRKREEEEQKREAVEQKAEEYRKERQRLIEKAQSYVLTMSARDYAEGVGKRLSDYDFMSVFKEDLKYMVQRGEEIGAEVIVDARLFSSDYLLGTALIPKKNKH
jgi:phosphoenolpyruvate carboxylase